VGLVSLLGFGAFMLASLVVGVRMLRLAARTRELAETCIGSALFFSGALGYGLIMVALRMHASSPETALDFMRAGVLCAQLGGLALLVATWRIFRRAERWAAALFAALAALIGAACVLVFTTDPIPPRTISTPVFWTSTAATIGAFGWSAFESLRYHGLLRLRLRLGLVEAELVDRFRLWGFAASCAAAIQATGVLNRMIVPAGIHPVLLVIQSCVGLASACAIWLAFFPPAAYRRRFAPAPDLR
jgi:hypothetical protein